MTKPKTLGELTDYTFKHCWSGTRSESKTMINANKVLEYFGVSRNVQSISRTDIDEMKYHFKKQGNADSTINRKLSALSKIFCT